MKTFLHRFLAPINPRKLETRRRDTKECLNNLRTLHELLSELIETNGSKEELRAKMERVAKQGGKELPPSIHQRLDQLDV